MQNSERDDRIEVEIYNMRGQFIKRLSPNNDDKTLYYKWDGSNYMNKKVSTGSYILHAILYSKMKGSKFSQNVKIYYLKGKTL